MLLMIDCALKITEIFLRSKASKFVDTFMLSLLNFMHFIACYFMFTKKLNFFKLAKRFYCTVCGSGGGAEGAQG